MKKEDIDKLKKSLLIIGLTPKSATQETIADWADDSNVLDPGEQLALEYVEQLFQIRTQRQGMRIVLSDAPRILEKIGSVVGKVGGNIMPIIVTPNNEYLDQDVTTIEFFVDGVDLELLTKLADTLTKRFGDSVFESIILNGK